MIPLLIFSSIKFIFILFLLGTGGLFLLAGFKNWRWFHNMIFGKETSGKLNGGLGKGLTIAIGIALALLGLWLLF